jgi:hypothetical protein
MKTHLDIKNEGTLDGEVNRFGFDPNSTTHLMNLFIEAYKDRVLAPIREYATNAYDSHVAAGNPAPIEIETPNEMRPVYVVRDFGLGMDEKDIREQFSQYGFSSKRDSDDAVGMLGIGCKSAFAYTDQFTMVCVKNNHRITVLLTRDADGCAAWQIVDSEFTSDPNGVEIQLPVVGSPVIFNDRVRAFFRYWEPGTVLIDGQPPDADDQFPNEEDIEIDPGCVTLTKRTGGRDIIVMGNVPYPVDHMQVDRLVNRQSQNYSRRDMWCAVIRVPIGAVNFTPSREDLDYTKRTTQLLDEARSYISGAIDRIAVYDVASADSFADAFNRATKWRDGFNKYTFTYKGLDVPTHFTVRQPAFKWNTARSPYSRSVYYEAEKVKTLQKAVDLRNMVHVVGYTGTSVPPSIKAKVKKYIQDERAKNTSITSPWSLEGLTGKVLFLSEQAHLPWLHGDPTIHVVDYEVIKAVQLPKDETKTRKRDNNEFGVINAEGRVVRQHKDWIAGQADTVTYVTREEYTERTTYGWRSLVSALGSIPCVVPNKTNTDAFMEAFPNAEHAKDWIERTIKEFHAALEPRDIFLLAHGDEYSMSFPPYVWDGRRNLSDREYAAFLDDVGRPGATSAVHKKNQWKVLCNAAGEFNINPPPWPRHLAHGLAIRMHDLKDRYPLLAKLNDYSMSRRSRQGVIEYMNATYLLREGLHLSRVY